MGIIFLFLFCGQAHINYQGEIMDKNIERILNLLPQPVKNFYIENIHRNITEIRVRSGFDIKVTADGKHITIQNTVTDKKFLENLYLNTLVLMFMIVMTIIQDILFNI